ncbi:ribonuclease HI [Dehalococcoidia bacterium]|nr:ribonuclease HI [Dehalococcoidia bacterium]
MTTINSVKIHTDGSSLGNPGPGGYGVLVQYADRETELSGGFSRTTNNRMEIIAVIKGLETLDQGSNVSVYSDSKYVVDAINNGWARRWKANSWKRNKKGEPALNPDLWDRLLQLIGQHNVDFNWVRGHSGNIENERADKLAVTAAAGKNLPPDAGYQT